MLGLFGIFAIAILFLMGRNVHLRHQLRGVPKASKDHFFKRHGWAPAWMEAIAVTIALILTVGQLYLVTRQMQQVTASLNSTALASIFQQQADINNMFQEPDNENLYPYFFLGKIVPDDPELQQQAEMAAYTLLDFFAHIVNQQEINAFTVDRGWRAYIQGSFQQSPVLCQALWDGLDLYGGDESILWHEYAKDSCRAWKPYLEGAYP